MAILAAQCGKSPAHEECWIGMRRNNKRESVEFHAKATPLVLGDTDLVVLALHDISDQKRRGVLEQSFLHDARNLLGGIITWSDVLQHEFSDEAVTSIRALALQLREQLAGHRILAQAEKGELVVNRAALDLPALARALREAFSRHPRGEGKDFVIRFPSTAVPPISDQSLVLRVLSNMVTNALEASSAGATVAVRYDVLAGAPTFTVHNPGTISAEVAPRIFQRSFSTKSEPGHGVGTYSMRLLAEQYLGGRVTFTSSPESGTAFTLTLPAA
jgi:signal transduction histidine kinase